MAIPLKILYYKLKKFYEYNKGFGRKIIELIPKPNTNTNQNVNTILSHLLDKPTGVSDKKKSRRKTRVTFNFKHIGFYHIDMSDIQSEIEEAAQLLVYFSVNDDLSEAESDDDLSEEYDDSSEDENVVTNTLTNDPEVSTLEDSEANESDDEISTQFFNEEQVYTEYDTECEYNDNDNDENDNDENDNDENDNDENDSIS